LDRRTYAIKIKKQKVTAIEVSFVNCAEKVNLYFILISVKVENNRVHKAGAVLSSRKISCMHCK
jgi:hypothetical protein